MNEPPEPEIFARPTVRLGLVSDTHVPDRVSQLHPELLSGLRSAGLDLLVHLGDICEQRVLNELAAVAPLVAVRGNRDWAFLDQLPLTLETHIHGKRCLFMHGHGNARRYIIDKMHHALEGYRLSRYLNAFRKFIPEMDVIAFGHTHIPESRHLKGCLIFNPGSASVPGKREQKPGFGVIEISRDGRISAEQVPLSGYQLRNRQWRLMDTDAAD